MSKKVALIDNEMTCIRKMVVILNSMLRDGMLVNECGKRHSLKFSY